MTTIFSSKWFGRKSKQPRKERDHPDQEWGEELLRRRLFDFVLYYILNVPTIRRRRRRRRRRPFPATTGTGKPPNLGNKYIRMYTHTQRQSINHR